MAQNNKKNPLDNIGRKAVGAGLSTMAGSAVGTAVNVTGAIGMFTELGLRKERKPQKISRKGPMGKQIGRIVDHITHVGDKILGRTPSKKVEKGYLDSKAEKAFNNEIRRQSKKVGVPLYDNTTFKRAYGTKGKSWRKENPYLFDTSKSRIKKDKLTPKQVKTLKKTTDSLQMGMPMQPGAYLPDLKVPNWWPGKSKGQRLMTPGIMTSKKVRSVAPEVTLHELGHAKYHSGGGPTLKAIKAFGTKGGLMVAMGASVGQAFTKKDSIASKAATAAAIGGTLPILLDEGHANVHAYRSMKKVVKKHKLKPKYLKGTLKTLGPAYATYLGLASIPIITNLVAKKQKDKEL